MRMLLRKYFIFTIYAEVIYKNNGLSEINLSLWAHHFHIWSKYETWWPRYPSYTLSHARSKNFPLVHHGSTARHFCVSLFPKRAHTKLVCSVKCRRVVLATGPLRIHTCMRFWAHIVTPPLDFDRQRNRCKMSFWIYFASFCTFLDRPRFIYTLVVAFSEVWIWMNVKNTL